MTDLGELKKRVDHAVDELSAAQNARRNQHDSLVQLLADLEVKFDARHEELVYCHSRIADLEKANDQLNDLLNTVVQLIESGSVQDPDDPIFRASQMAADLVNLCAQSPVDLIAPADRADGDPQMVTVQAEVIDDRPSTTTPPEPAAPDIASTMPPPVSDPPPATAHAAEPAAPATPEASNPLVIEEEVEIEIIDTDVSPTEPSVIVPPVVEPEPSAPAAVSQVVGKFEDVSQEELDVELLLDDELDDPRLPQALLLAAKAAKMGPDEMAGRLAEVSAAVEAARKGEANDAIGQDVGDDLDIPGIDTVVEFDIADEADQVAVGPTDSVLEPTDDDTDIKALMARIQEAAEKARRRSDEPEHDEPIFETPPIPGKTGTS